MRNLFRAAAIWLALLPGLAFGQGLSITNSIPASTVLGRLGVGAGPVQAIPFATLLAQIGGTQSANTVFAGPSSGGVAAPTFRALVGADLPNPSASTLGGTQSVAAVAHTYMTGISTSGVPTVAIPVCADLSNAAASCATDATNATNIGSGTLNTARLPSPFTSGTASGNTSKFATTTGTLTNTHCASFDSNGNIQDSGGSCSGSSAMVLLETLTPSAVASIATSASWSGYTSIEFVFYNVVPVTNSVNLFVQVNSGGVQSTTYLNSSFASAGAGALTFSNATTPGIILNGGNTISNTAATGVSGVVRLTNVASTTTPKYATGTITFINGTSAASAVIGGWWNGGNGAVTGATILFSSGNISTGTIKVYGIQ